jgi:hypothetical protein
LATVQRLLIKIGQIHHSVAGVLVLYLTF